MIEQSGDLKVTEVRKDQLVSAEQVSRFDCGPYWPLYIEGDDGNVCSVLPIPALFGRDMRAEMIAPLPISVTKQNVLQLEVHPYFPDCENVLFPGLPLLELLTLNSKAAAKKALIQLYIEHYSFFEYPHLRKALETPEKWLLTDFVFVAGTPNSGKTTSVATIQAFLEEKGVLGVDVDPVLLDDLEKAIEYAQDCKSIQICLGDRLLLERMTLAQRLGVELRKKSSTIWSSMYRQPIGEDDERFEEVRNELWMSERRDSNPYFPEYMCSRFIQFMGGLLYQLEQYCKKHDGFTPKVCIVGLGGIGHIYEEAGNPLSREVLRRLNPVENAIATVADCGIFVDSGAYPGVNDRFVELRRYCPDMITCTSDALFEQIYKRVVRVIGPV
jgi:hypothetical protein